MSIETILKENKLVRELASQLSVKKICKIIGHDLPADQKALGSMRILYVCAAELTCHPGSAFFMRKGKESIELAMKAKNRGAKIIFSPVPFDQKELGIPVVVVPDSEEAFIQVCGYLRERVNAKIIALTGSVGKTTTKEMFRCVCETELKTMYSKGNRNGLAQVGMYMQRMSMMPWYKVYIQETGAAKPGLVEKGSRILKPDAFIVTNIGLNHIAYYGSQEGIMRDKLSIDKYLPNNGVAFLNYDDPLLKEQKLGHKIISYALNNKDADYYAEDIVEQDGIISFRIVDSQKGKKTSVKIHAFGKHNVINAVCAFAVGSWLGISSEKITEGLAKYRTEGTRQNLVKLGENKVLVDCYNASEVAADSAAGALDTINPEKDGKRIFVFGDIDDKLGDITEEVHRRVGKNFATHKIDSLVCFGPHAAWSAEEARALGMKVFSTESQSELYSYLENEINPGDVIAFKGGQHMCLSWAIDHLYGTSFGLLDGDVLKTESHFVEQDGICYKVIRDYGVVVEKVLKGAPKSIRLSDKVDGVSLVCIGKNAFIKSTIEEVQIPDPVRCIAQSAFEGCSSLKRISFPDNTLKTIERNAFKGCKSLKKVDIPKSVIKVHKSAFNDCK